MSCNSGSANSYNVNVECFCFCNQKARVSTAHTHGNYGRRFQGCANYRSSSRCNFFAWIDDQFQPQASIVIQRLVKQKMELQDNVKQLEECLKAKDSEICKKCHGNRFDLLLGLGLGFIVFVMGTYLISNH